MIHEGTLAQSIPAEKHHLLFRFVLGRNMGDHATVDSLVVASAVEIGRENVVIANFQNLVVQKGFAVRIFKAGQRLAEIAFTQFVTAVLKCFQCGVQVPEVYFVQKFAIIGFRVHER